MTHRETAPRSFAALFLMLLLAAAPLAFAQGPFGGGPGPGPGHGPGPGPAHGPGFGQNVAGSGAALGVPLQRLARYLELTEEQIAEAEAIFQAARDTAAPIRDEQRGLHQDLRALLDGDGPDATEVGNVVLELHANRRELRSLRQAALADFEALLTAEQLDKWESLKEMKEHFRGRRGGPQGGPQGGQGVGPGAGA